MIKSKTIFTDYGPVTFDLVLCDHIPCNEVAQPAFAVGWLKVSDYGVPVQSIGKTSLSEEDLHFCTATHLKEYLS